MDDSKVSIIVLGESGVGKTSLLVRFTKGVFRVHTATSSIDYIDKDVRLLNKTVHLELWDTAGQDRYRSIIRQYYRRADGVLLVYDVTDISSFMKLSNWLTELRDINENAAIIIVGNKSDKHDIKTVSRSTVRRYATKENVEYFETSAKDGFKVNEVFECLTLKVLRAKQLISSPASLSTDLSQSSDVESTASYFEEEWVMVPSRREVLRLQPVQRNNNSPHQCSCEN